MTEGPVPDPVSTSAAGTLPGSDAPTPLAPPSVPDSIAITAGDAERIHRGASFHAGEVVANRFTIRRLLGKGGMGAVYEALDKEMNAVVALKTILPGLDRSGNALARFRREIQVARLVTSRNVCRTFDIGYHPLAGGGDVIFVTMEFLPGKTLAEWLRPRVPLTLSAAMPLIQQMASGLEATHEKGVIHRDFKSANVMLVEERGALRAVITDFGLARLHDPGAGSEGLTRGPIGSPHAMAPEQVEGTEATPATDVYAFGVVVYEMLTGHWPHTGGNAQQLMFRRVSEPPTPPRVHNAAIDPRVEAVVLKCLEREQDARFQTAREVVAALLDATEEKPAESVTPPQAVATRWSIRARAAAAGIAAGIAVVVWLLAHDQPAAKRDAAISAPGPAVQRPVVRAASGAVPPPANGASDASVFAPIRAALARGDGDEDFTFSIRNGPSVREGQQITYEAFARTPGAAYLLVFDSDQRVTCLFFAESSPGPIALPTVRAKAPMGKSLYSLILATDPVGLKRGANYPWQEVLQKLKGTSFRSHEELIDVLP